MAGRVRIVWSLARVGLLTIGVLVGASRGCGFPASARQARRVRQTAADLRPTKGEAPKLTIRVYNYARLNPASLGSAEEVAAAIFGTAGIEVAWVDCPLPQAQYVAYSACQTRATATDIDLKLLPRAMAEKLHARDDLLGFARPCSDSDPACEVTIFNYMADELATYGYREDAILGHAIAHEMAHVLVGGAHAETGIMRREWTPTELQRMSWGVLLHFSDQQSKALVAAAQRREAAREELQEEASLGQVDLARSAK